MQARWRAVAGGVLVLFDAWLIWRAVRDESFRFIWARDQGEFLVFVVAVGLAAVLLIAIGLQPRERDRSGGRWMVRVAAYLIGAAALMLLALWAGTAYYTATDCPNRDADCLSLLGGMAWSLLTLPISALVIAVIEIGLWRRRRRKDGEVAG